MLLERIEIFMSTFLLATMKTGEILILSFIILSSGYFLMGLFSSFAGVFLTFFYVAIGAALFKPIISATIAKCTDDTNSSIGFGIFYMVINIGGLIGPLVASELREISWNYIFIMSSGAMVINMAIVLIFYREPEQQPQAGNFSESVKKVFMNIYLA